MDTLDFLTALEAELSKFGDTFTQLQLRQAAERVLAPPAGPEVTDENVDAHVDAAMGMSFAALTNDGTTVGHSRTHTISDDEDAA